VRAFLALALGLMVLLGAQGAWAAEKETVTFDMEKWRVWLEEVRTEASAKGIKPSIVDQALTGIDPIPRIIELDRRQPEFTLTFAQYIERVVPDRRVQKGRQMLAQHRALLEKVGNEIGVQPRFIVALWGIETDFGRLTGGFNVVNALATLAFDGRRSAYFRKELFDALQILDEGHIAPEKMTGSWAGAMAGPIHALELCELRDRLRQGWAARYLDDASRRVRLGGQLSQTGGLAGRSDLGPRSALAGRVRCGAG